MPPPCQSANTPGANGAAAMRDSVNGTLPLVIDMLSSTPGEILRPAVRLSPPVARTCRTVSTAQKRKTFSVAYRSAARGMAVAEIAASKNAEESESTMPLKPNGALCQVREQIIEDAASGLTLQFEGGDGPRLVARAGGAEHAPP